MIFSHSWLDGKDRVLGSLVNEQHRRSHKTFIRGFFKNIYQYQRLLQKGLLKFPHQQLFISLLFFMLGISLFAGGRPTEWEPISIEEAWTHEIDLQDRDPGTYNVIIRGRDRAGNETIEGPFNLRIDPDSDIPQARFIVPSPGQVIRGTTNSIGVAIDDDGIETVLVSINDGPSLPAQGAEYWSFPLEVESLEDGVHRMTIQPKDINGLTGNITETWFIVDTQGPELQITSHESGALVRGRVQFSGTAFDINGIQSVIMTQPGYRSFTRRGEPVFVPEQTSQLRLRTNRQSNQVSFSFTLDTRDMPDGAYIIGLRAEDKVGTKTEESFLVFIDNRAPTIQILSPDPQTPQWGDITFVGSVVDDVGIERMWYQVGNHTQDIPLFPGDRFWSATIDARSLSGRNPRIRFYAQDLSGNVSQIQQQIRLDSSLHNPSIQLLNQFIPSVGRQPESILLSEPLFVGIQGRHKDYTLVVTGLDTSNPRAETQIQANTIATIDISHLAPGQRRFTFRGIDPEGNQSTLITRDLILLPDEPALILESMSLRSGIELDFVPGLNLATNQRITFRGSSIGSARVQQLQYALVSSHTPEGAEIRSFLTQPSSQSKESILQSTQISWTRGTLRNQGAGQTFEGSFDPIHSGITWLLLKGRDLFDREFLEVASFNLVNQALPSFGPGIILGSKTSIPSRLVLSQPGPLPGMVLTRGAAPVSDISFTQVEQEGLEDLNPTIAQLTRIGNTLSLTPVRSGQEVVQITARDIEGRVIRSGPFTLEVSPSALVPSPLQVRLDPSFTGFSLPFGVQTQLSGRVSFAGQLNSLAFGLDGADLRTLRTQPTETPGLRTFNISLPRNIAPRHEPYELLIEATDDSGNSDTITYLFFVLPTTPLDQYHLAVLSNGEQPRVSSPQPNQPQMIFPYGVQKNQTILLSQSISSWFSGVALPVSVTFQPIEQILEHQGTMTPPQEPIRFRIDNQQVIIEPHIPGHWSGTMLVVDQDGIEYVFGPFDFVIDVASPVAEFSHPLQGQFLAQVPEISVILDDDSTPLHQLLLRYRVVTTQGVSDWISLDTREESNRNELLFIPNFDIQSGIGQVIIELEIEDQIGNTTLISDSFHYQPHGARATFITPGEERINGRTSITGYLSDNLGIQGAYLISFSQDLSFEDISPWLGEHLRSSTNQQVPDDLVLDTGEDQVPRVIRFIPLVVQGSQAFFSLQFDFSQAYLENNQMYLITVAKSGVVHGEPLQADISLEDDLPTLWIQTPSEGEVVTEDLVVRGMAFDDDGIGSIFWRLNDGDWQEIPGTSNYSISLPLRMLENNEQILEVYPVDMFGLEGPKITRRFFVSKDQPQITLLNPQVNSIHSGMVLLQGTATDANGIQRVEISLDNGVSFFQAQGTDEWLYPLDSRVFVDGTYSIQIRALDSLGIENLVFALVNIDNTPPFVDIAGTSDSMTVTRYFDLAGRLEDLGGIESFQVMLEPINSLGSSTTIDLPTESTFSTRISLEEMDPGWYNLQYIATDRAGNSTTLVRNLFIEEEMTQSGIELFFPLEGEVVSGRVLLEGRIDNGQEGTPIQIIANGQELAQGVVGSRGYFQYELLAEDLGFGQIPLEVQVIYSTEHTEVPRASQPRAFILNRSGPSVSIESHRMGDFIANRPWVSGNLRYFHTLDPDEPANRRALELFTPRSLRISLDNGRTFTPISFRGNSWTYRIETDPLPPGPLPVLLEAEYNNGSVASIRSIFTVDKSYPQITLLSPSEGARLNTSVTFRGIALDDHGLESLDISLRPGDKAGYEVPSFIQGMYLDTQFLGLTYWKVGLGFTFFDDNVKLQANFGVGPRTTASGDPARLSGYFIGGKLLANVFSLPFNALFGPDWQWLSLNIAIGADFSYIRLYDPITIENPNQPDRVEPGVVLSAIVLQLEFPRIRIDQWGFLNTYSFYTEPQLWFIPSDVSPSVELKLTFGIRIGLF